MPAPRLQVHYDKPQRRYERVRAGASAAERAGADAEGMVEVAKAVEVVPAGCVHLALGARVLVVLPHSGNLGDETRADSAALGRVTRYDVETVSYDVLLDMRFGTRHFTTKESRHSGSGGGGSGGSGGGGGGAALAAHVAERSDAAAALSQKRQVVRSAPGQILHHVEAWRVHLVTEEEEALGSCVIRHPFSPGYAPPPPFYCYRPFRSRLFIAPRRIPPPTATHAPATGTLTGARSSARWTKRAWCRPYTLIRGGSAPSQGAGQRQRIRRRAVAAGRWWMRAAPTSMLDVRPPWEPRCATA